MVDSSKWSVIEGRLKCIQARLVIPSASGGETKFIEQGDMVKRYGAAVS